MHTEPRFSVPPPVHFLRFDRVSRNKISRWPLLPLLPRLRGKHARPERATPPKNYGFKELRVILVVFRLTGLRAFFAFPAAVVRKTNSPMLYVVVTGCREIVANCCFGNCQANQPIHDMGSKRNAQGLRRGCLNWTPRMRFQVSRCRVFSLVYPRPRLYERLSVLIFGRHTAYASFAHRTRTRFTDQLSLELC